MKSVLDSYRKIKPVLSTHARPRNVFDFLEKTNYKGVYFSALNYNRKERSVSFVISSKSSISLLMQLAVFDDLKKNKKGIEEIEASSFSVEEDNRSSQVKIIIDQSILGF